jgi:hypothetical protein
MNGGSSDYYNLPFGCESLQDVIEGKDMNWSQANIFKAAYRWDEKPNLIYNLEKIVWFGNDKLQRVLPPTETIEVTLDGSTILELSIAAHARQMSLNDFIVQIAVEYANFKFGELGKSIEEKDSPIHKPENMSEMP